MNMCIYVCVYMYKCILLYMYVYIHIYNITFLVVSVLFFPTFAPRPANPSALLRSGRTWILAPPSRPPPTRPPAGVLHATAHTPLMFESLSHSATARTPSPRKPSDPQFRHLVQPNPVRTIALALRASRLLRASPPCAFRSADGLGPGCRGPDEQRQG